MPTRNISLTRRQGASITKVAALRARIAAGVRDIEEGDFDEVDGADLEQYLARLTSRRTRKRASLDRRT
jgi:hypothetical protein